MIILLGRCFRHIDCLNLPGRGATSPGIWPPELNLAETPPTALPPAAQNYQLVRGCKKSYHAKMPQVAKSYHAKMPQVANQHTVVGLGTVLANGWHSYHQGTQKTAGAFHTLHPAVAVLGNLQSCCDPHVVVHFAFL